MTEKSYGGNNGVREHVGGKVTKVKSSPSVVKTPKATSKKIVSNSKLNEDLNELDSYKKAGEIAKKVVEYAKSLIKPDMLLIEIAKKVEDKTIELGGEVAFPVNLSIDDIAAHYHPTIDDDTKATGLLKVDIGVHVNGFVADTAFSLDLTPDKRHKELIQASQEALDSALSILEKDPSLNDIGSAIQQAIQKRGFSPVVNLCGHSLDQYQIHAGITIPNHANNSPHKLEEGSYAIEPFATTGEGKIYEGPASNIYQVVTPRNVRGDTARRILEYVWEKYETLPFSLRELQEKFGNIAKLGLRELEQNGIIHSYPQLIEVSHHPVAQSEHTFIKTPEGKIIITTR